VKVENWRGIRMKRDQSREAEAAPLFFVGIFLDFEL
jgi:hypothetical protein